MTHHQPDPAQMKLPFTRKEQLGLRRRIFLPRDEKWLLWMIDDHIPADRKSWDLTFELLAAETSMSVSAIRRAVKGLADKVLIDVEKISGRYHETRRRFSIIWPNVEEYADANPVSLKRILSDGKDSFQAEKNPVSVEGIFSDGNDSIYTKNAPLNAHTNAPSSTPPVDPMVVMVQGVINRAKEVIAQARAVGMTDKKITAVFEHWKAHPDRWKVGILVDRLRRQGAADQPADQGWFGEPDGYRPPPAPVIDLEPLHGPSLDAMAEGELKELISDREVRWQNECLQFGRKHRDFRPVLLKLLHRRKSAAVC